MIHARIYFLIALVPLSLSRPVRLAPRINYFTDLRFWSQHEAGQKGVTRVYFPTRSSYTASYRCVMAPKCYLVVSRYNARAHAHAHASQDPKDQKPQPAPVAKSHLLPNKSNFLVPPLSPCSYSRICTSFSPSPSCARSAASTPLSRRPVSPKDLFSTLTGLN